MKLSKRRLLLVSFMLFSLFFGAGNLIFPPFLGKEAGSNMFLASIGFLITAVILPILGVIVIAKFKGLESLASKVHPVFASIFTIIIFIAIGPGLGIPRAASVPFEMAIAPYLNTNTPYTILMIAYTLIFFIIAMWLSLTPSKLPKRIGAILTPSLLGLLIIVFITFLFKGNKNVAPPLNEYLNNPFLKGFTEGYLTLDTIAALNFGIVIAVTLSQMGIKKEKALISSAIKAGIIAGAILSAVYLMLTYMGMQTSGLNQGSENGALILRNIVYMLFGDFGALVIALIFTLACLTTSIALITSIAEYFSDKFKRFTYKQMVVIIVVSSFVIANFGLNTILSITVPVLYAIYPVAIILILLALFDKLYKDNKYIYPITITSVGLISLIHALSSLGLSLGLLDKVVSKLWGYDLGFGWVVIAILAILVSLILDKVKKHKTVN